MSITLLPFVTLVVKCENCSNRCDGPPLMSTIKASFFRVVYFYQFWIIFCPTMKFSTIFLFAIIYSFQQAKYGNALTCYSCSNCAVDYQSFSITCDASQTHCAKVASIYIDYLVMARSCAYQCTEQSTSVIGVTCCTGDNCNTAVNVVTSTTPLYIYLSSTIVSILMLRQ